MSIGRAGTVALLLAAWGCGRSENVGWQDREAPRETAPPAEVAPPPAAAAAQAADPLQREYQQLSRALAPLQMQAFADTAIQGAWEKIRGDAEARILERSEFHQSLLERQRELEAALAQVGTPGDTLTPEQVTKLRTYYGNAQTEFARVTSQELQSPEFAWRVAEFQAVLFQRMLELQPDQAPALERLLELEQLIRARADTLGPGAGGPPPR